MNTKNEKNSCESLDFVEKLQKMALTEEKEQVISNLQASKKIYSILEKAGVPIGSKSGNYIKVADNPSKWEWIPIKNKVESNTQRRTRIANSANLIKGIKTLNVNSKNYKQVGNQYLAKMKQEIKKRNIICKVNGKRITDITKHIYIQRHSLKDKIQRTEVLPLVFPILEKYGKKGKYQVDPKGDYQEIVGRAEIINKSGKKQNIGIAVIVADNRKGGQTVKFVSVFVVDNKLIKSCHTSVLADTCHASGGNPSYRLGNDFQSPASNLSIPQTQKKSREMLKKSLGLNDSQVDSYIFSTQNKLNKSFFVSITDITENNKNQKVEQLQKALYALYEQKPFVINHISTENDKSKRYNDVTLKINNFNKDKIEKAVHSVAMTLDTSVKTSKGEPFMFKSQEDLTNRIISQFLKTTRKLYLFLIKYFDLPEIDVMTKSTMIWKGKIIYNPETGKPLTNIEWNKFVKALDDFVNRNYKGIGDRIILSSETLGRILDRMAKYNTLKNITELKLEDIKYSGKTFDWISESVKNLKNTFGESLDRTQTTRIEVMQQSATQYISNIEDQLKNKIKQTLIDGIKNRESKTQVSQNLFNNCVGINRDFQRWADSEVQAATTKAYINEEIYNTPEETNIYFKRREIVDDNTCKKCEELNGVVVKYSKVPLTDEHIKDDFAKYAIWDGKTTGHIPETIQHPYCRGCWLRYYPMKNPIADALSTIKEKNNNKWDKAVEQAKKEFEDKGIKNPNDKTKGYVARIREIYNEK